MHEGFLAYNLFMLRTLCAVSDGIHVCVVVQICPWFKFYLPIILWCGNIMIMGLKQ